MSCDTYFSAAVACASCSVLDGSPCAADLDCSKYLPNYHCDLGRPGGYCTAGCTTADDCSAAGPESCATSRNPSFAPLSPAGSQWCLLGCRSDADCRASEGYSCMNIDATTFFGVCDAP